MPLRSRLVVRPTDDTVARYAEERRRAEHARTEHARLRNVLTRTADGVRVTLYANVKPSDTYNVMVRNRCTQNGIVMWVDDEPVLNGQASPFTFAWSGGGAAQCTAYVWVFPDSETALKVGSMTYSVAGS